jgi:hypothetical protein
MIALQDVIGPAVLSPSASRYGGKEPSNGGATGASGKLSQRGNKLVRRSLHGYEQRIYSPHSIATIVTELAGQGILRPRRCRPDEIAHRPSHDQNILPAARYRYSKRIAPVGRSSHDSALRAADARHGPRIVISAAAQRDARRLPGFRRSVPEPAGSAGQSNRRCLAGFRLPRADRTFRDPDALDSVRAEIKLRDLMLKPCGNVPPWTRPSIIWSRRRRYWLRWKCAGSGSSTHFFRPVRCCNAHRAATDAPCSCCQTSRVTFRPDRCEPFSRC